MKSKLDVRQSLVWGIIQGLTEFLPVSSTAHLILAPQLLNVPGPRAEIAHAYDTFIQIGTVIPVLIYFWQDWLNLLQAAGRIITRFSVKDDPEERMVIYLVLATIPAGVLGLALNKYVEPLGDPGTFPPAYLVIGAALIAVGVVMWWAESTSRKSRDIEHLRMPDAILMGFAQALALWPGVSRSGSTITAGLFAGLTREAAARFSFLLMVPIMFAASGFKLYKLLKGGTPVSHDELLGMLLAAITAAIVGFFAIVFLLKWVRTRSLQVFAWYRILLGAFVFGLYFVQRH
jgi:undecaprenyl-diphosphatase